jgi:uncharacterized repeat protein (TIGR01451 family)
VTDCTRADWPTTTTDRTNTRQKQDRPKEDRPESKQFESFSLHCLQAGLRVRFQARGASMSPTIRDGEMVYVKPASEARLRRGDIVLVKSDYGFRLHRLVRADSRRNVFITRGDCGQQNDPPVRHDQILGVAIAKDVLVGKKILRAKFRGISGSFLQFAAQAQSIAGKLTRVMGLRLPRRAASRPSASRTLQSRTNKLACSSKQRTSKLFGALALLLMLLAAPYARAQVALDSASSTEAEETGNATRTLTFAHTTTATGTNLLMLVGVSINITNATTAAVTGVTYNGSTLFLLGAHNDAGNTRRVEMWYMQAPATGNHNVAVKVNIPAAATVGVTAGAVTFTGVDQTVPLGSFVSADGAAAGYSQLYVPSVVNGMILDTLAIGGPETVTVPGPQVSDWNLSTANGFGQHNDPPDVTGSGSTRTGAPDVPLSETFSANSNWSEGAVSINPTAADIGVTTTVGSAVFLGSNTTYTINVFNNGTSAANTVKLTDTLASGMTLVSATPSTGTCVTTANPIVCTIGNMASGAHATVTVVETAAAAGSYSNTAVVSDSGTPPDPNTGNNTYVAVATVQSAACATVAQAAPGTGLTGTLNTYYPGTASVAAGATSIPIGAATGAGSGIAAGNLLLIIQMQDASINLSNNVDYGNGDTGQGFTALNSAGDYEFVTAKSAVGTGGGTVTIAGAGTGGGTVFAYHSSAVSATAGQSTYQVIVVPQYTTASFSSTSPPTALAWNGSTGGVLAIDTSNTLTLNGATISVNGLGFRGGAGLQLSGVPNPAPPTLPASTDFQQTAPSTYTATTVGSTTNGQPGWDAPKGEGIAGTPAWVEYNDTFLATGTGYPSGAFGTFNLTSVANAAGGDTVYTGTITGGAGNTLAGYIFVISGFTNAANNGRFISTASTATTLTLTNAAGVAQTGTATANLDGSMARGAPGNAGGGGTDGDPQTASTGGNDENAGGGGGGNGGAGGFGGDSWDTNLSVGGEGGAAFPATINRIAMGGGGGAGTRNNSNGDNQASGGSTGGGIIIIRTYALSGTATLTANGVNAYNATSNDAGGGGGAGGSIVVLSANGGEGGLTLQANGGSGGDAWMTEPFTLANRHGPGGGGGGGVLLVSGTPASASVTGGTDGTTENPGVTYGSTSGAAGFSVTNESITQTSGTQSGAECTPDMTLAKNSSGLFTRGLTATYTIPVSNVSTYGPSSGTVTVNDTLPIGLMPTGASGTGWSCSVASQTVSCTDSTALTAGSTYPSITVTANVLQTAPSTITNTATVGGGGEVNLANDTATNVAAVVSSADLAVTDMAAPNPVAAGSNITYTQVVTNNGPSAADTATLVQAVPANTTFVSISAPAGWTCATPGVGGTGNVVCSTLSMTGSTAATFSMVVKVTAGTTSGTVITDTATVNSSVSDPNTANNTASAAVVVGTTTQAEMTVTNVASPNPVAAGANITYTQTATNIGAAAATNPTLTETTPLNTTFQSISAPTGTTCTTPAVGGTGAISCTAPSAPAGTSGTVTVVVQVNAGTAAGTVISDTATVNATNQGLGANAATATDVVSSAAQVDLTLATVATPLTVFAGNNITYTETVTNGGPSAATAVSLTESIPNTTVVSASAPAGWTCATTATTVTCTDPSLASGASVNIGVVVSVAASDTTTPITATSTLSATNAATTSNMLNTPVTEACDLAVTNTGTPNPVAAGGVITYTQVVTNTGPSNCGTATFTEPFPTNTTFTSLTSAAGWSCTTTGTISCSNPTVAPNSTSTFTVKVTVAAGASAGTLITDTATVATTTRDTNTANNSASVVIPVAGATQADLTVTNSGSPNPVTAGQNVTYMQSVTNSGPAGATTVVLTETLPAGTTFVSLASSVGTCTTAAPYTCSIGSLALNATATVTFVVTVGPTATPGSAVTNTATVTSASSNPNPVNYASATVYVAGSAALSITNSASPVPVLAGSNITYAQVVTNAGPSAATNAIFTETTPPNTTFVQLTPIPSGWSCILPAVGAAGTITCTNSSFAMGTASFPVVVKVATATPAGTAVNDTATINSSTTDPSPANNSATANDVVALSTQADLIATNSAAPTSVAAGSNITYTQSVTNNGPSTATATTFTQTTPPNTTFQSITMPSGWTCTTPAVGAVGTITCTDSSSLALNTPANFTLVLQVNSGTPSGTNIAEAVTANATNIVPSLTSNTATANVVVANANSADMAIVKTATPSPTVSEGDPLTYSLAVTNNGPASATDVTVTDPLPSQVTFLSVTSTVGTCSQANGTVTCLLGTMADAATATITILTLPITEGTALNTASVTADQTDPVPGNNSSSQTEYITYPTSIRLHSFVARIVKDKTGVNRTALLWKTGGEAHNLGFNIYREQNGGRVRLNSSLIAGSALLTSGSSLKHSAKTYAWVDSTKIDSSKIDSSPASGSASYWLEDVDINGTRIMHGPVTAEAAPSSPAESAPAISLMLNQLNQSQPAAARNEISHPVENVPQDLVPTSAQRQKQFELAANPAVKIYVKHEGWQSVSQPELISAGLDPNVDPAYLHLYAEAIEQPIRITGATAGPGGFGPQATLQFYGTGIDTPYSGTRVYWLVTGEAPGQRIPQLPTSTGPNQPPASFPYTVELTQHTTYFGALITSNGNNFFGAFISSTPTDQTLQVPHLDPNSTAAPVLEVILQGVILGFPHDVAVTLNGTSIGDITFTGQAKGKFRATLPPGVLQEGANTVTLTAQNGEFDTSVVQTIHIIYPHSYIADSDSLQFIGRSGDELKVTGFTSAPVAVLDITDPEQPVQLTPQISSNSGQTQYALDVQVPWSAAATQWHTLLAVASDRVASVAGIGPNHPSQWHRAQAGSDIVMISHQPFTAALAPLVQAHHAAGQSVSVVPVDDLYDEYTFGQHSPFAIKDFLYAATHVWHTAPHYLLLNGGASLDPRNYLGFGHLDFVPTKIVPTSMLMTASDDWFSDFTNTGTATIATGRFPVSTQQEAELVAGRVATYEGQSTNGPWTSQALMVADVNDTENFTQDSQIVQAQLPKSMQATDVFASTLGIPTSQQDIISSINSGQLLVNYAGHGSEDEWSGDDLFNNTTASSLTNGSSLPVFLIMDCLNGFFQGVPEDSLAVALMLAPNGGAVAVLASSGLNLPAPQTQLNKLIVQNALHAPYPALGDAILNAKSAINDPGVRKTYNLLGDPAMQLKSPAAPSAH